MASVYDVQDVPLSELGMIRSRHLGMVETQKNAEFAKSTLLDDDGVFAHDHTDGDRGHVGYKSG